MQIEVEHRKTPGELDELTLSRAKRGESEAFRRLVERYHVPVHALIWRMGAERFGDARVEELTQETFLRVHRALPRFELRGAAKLSTWILTIATRLTLNDLRKAGRDISLEALHEEPRSDDRPDQAYERQRAREAVGRAVASLAPDHRAVLVLREWHEQSYADIGETLGLDVGTVKSRLSRARARLREALLEVDDGQ